MDEHDEAVKRAVELYWLTHYEDGGLCCLCGNIGRIVAQAGTFSLKDINSRWCICPTGRDRRKFDELEDLR